MGTCIVIVVLAVILFFAFRSSKSHFKGEGGCCGGGSPVEKTEKKVLEGSVIAEKTLKIEGMHCDNCRYRVERFINEIEGASAVVKLSKNVATVSMDREVSEQELRAAVARAGYKVTDIV